MKKPQLLLKITGTETPLQLSERENAIIEKCLEIINKVEQAIPLGVKSDHLLEIDDKSYMIHEPVFDLIHMISQERDYYKQIIIENGFTELNDPMRLKDECDPKCELKGFQGYHGICCKIWRMKTPFDKVN